MYQEHTVSFPMIFVCRVCGGNTLNPVCLPLWTDTTEMAALSCQLRKPYTLGNCCIEQQAFLQQPSFVGSQQDASLVLREGSASSKLSRTCPPLRNSKLARVLWLWEDTEWLLNYQCTCYQSVQVQPLWESSSVEVNLPTQVFILLPKTYSVWRGQSDRSIHCTPKCR